MQQDSFKICNLCSKEADIYLMNFGVNHATSAEATQIDFFGILVPFHFFYFFSKSRGHKLQENGRNNHQKVNN